MVSRSLTHLRSSFGSTVASNVALASINLVTGIMTARLLGVTGRGQLAAIQTLPTALAGICMLGMPEALVFFSAKRPSESGQFIRGAVSVAFVASVATAAAAYFALPYFLAAQSPGVVRLGQLYLLICPLFALVWLPFHVMRGLGRFMAWNAFRIMPSALWLVILLAVPLATAATPGNLSVAYLVMTAFAGFPIWTVVRRAVGPLARGGAAIPRSLLRFGLPSTAATLPQTLSLRLGQIVMAATVAPRQLGLYVAALGTSTAVMPILQALGLVLFPRLAGADDDKRVPIFRSTARRTALVTLATVGLVGALQPIAIVTLFGPSFSGAVAAAIILTGATGVAGFCFVLEAGFRGLDAQKLNVVAEFVGLGVIGVTMLPLIRAYGVEGAAVSSLLGYSATASLLIRGLWRLA